tara:strand:- start:415 stop:546 length:132 start_codon:yes stop_codon:yes gene_type:complete
MKEQTFNKRLQQLIDQLNIHSHKKEILEIMAQQVADDTKFIRM